MPVSFQINSFLRVGMDVRAFHPRTLGVIYPGRIVRAKKDREAFLIDFSPITAKAGKGYKSSFWVHYSHIVGEA